MLVRQVAGMRTARYRAVPPKIDRRRSISVVGDRLKGEIDHRQLIEREKGRKKKRKKKKKKEKKRKKYLSPARGPRPCAVVAHEPSPPTGRGRSFSHAGRKIEATLRGPSTSLDLQATCFKEAPRRSSKPRRWALCASAWVKLGEANLTFSLVRSNSR
ncbi:hypothetical protein GW17_00016844 [Ensete ventricosum]|nr:hypothetical protein GW17_00016844 [Ensete ventricosum]